MPYKDREKHNANQRELKRKKREYYRSIGLRTDGKPLQRRLLKDRLPDERPIEVRRAAARAAADFFGKNGYYIGTTDDGLHLHRIEGAIC